MAYIQAIRKHGFKLQFNVPLLLILMMISTTELTFIRPSNNMHDGIQIKSKQFDGTRLNYSGSEHHEDNFKVFLSRILTLINLLSLFQIMQFKSSIDGQLLQRNKRDNQSQDDSTATEEPINTTNQPNGSNTTNGTCAIGHQLALFLTLLGLNLILLVAILVLTFFICCRGKKTTTAAKPMEQQPY